MAAPSEMCPSVQQRHVPQLSHRCELGALQYRLTGMNPLSPQADHTVLYLHQLNRYTRNLTYLNYFCTPHFVCLCPLHAHRSYFLAPLNIPRLVQVSRKQQESCH